MTVLHKPAGKIQIANESEIVRVVGNEIGSIRSEIDDNTGIIKGIKESVNSTTALLSMSFKAQVVADYISGTNAITNEMILQSVDVVDYPLWEADTAYAEGTVLRHVDGLYRVQQPVHSQSHQPPDAEGMLAVYTPVQVPKDDGKVLPWVSGEIVAQGDRRMYNGVVYEAAQNPGANVWPPDAVPALWREVS